MGKKKFLIINLGNMILKKCLNSKKHYFIKIMQIISILKLIYLFFNIIKEFKNKTKEKINFTEFITLTKTFFV